MQLVMPALSPGQDVSTLVRWHISEGEAVRAGQVLADLESEKASTEFISPAAGLVVRRLVADGTENVPVGTPIAELLADASSVPAPIEPVSAMPAFTVTQPMPVDGGSDVTDRMTPAAVAVSTGGPRVRASPLARCMAYERGIDLVEIRGTGPRGRIVQADIELASAARSQSTNERASASSPVASAPETPHRIVRLTSMRRAIARNLAAAKREVPHFYLSIDCDVERLAQLRCDLESQAATKLSLNDLIIRAVALALRAVPAAHVQYSEDHLFQFERADVAIAVAVDGGLVTPVLRGADGLSVAEISREVRSLIERARTGTLQSADLSGGTFTISNLGMYGVQSVVPVINCPQAAILGVGTAQRRPVVRSDAVAISTVMSLTAAFDHRAIDGAVGAQFLAAVQHLLQNPLVLALPATADRERNQPL
jgi:pyruvate dehydrogenase E2 component (dihydrolipoamide acetyltransferase)